MHYLVGVVSEVVFADPKIGGKGIRTPGLLIANETLYQLSYTPVHLENGGINVTRTPLSTFFTCKHARCRACDLTSLFPVEQLSHGRVRRPLQRSQEPRLFLRE